MLSWKGTTDVACGASCQHAEDPRSAVAATLPEGALQDQISKLTALVDHYYAAYRETRALLDRRDRQLAELRRKLNGAPVLVRNR